MVWLNYRGFSLICPFTYMSGQILKVIVLRATPNGPIWLQSNNSHRLLESYPTNLHIFGKRRPRSLDCRYPIGGEMHELETVIQNVSATFIYRMQDREELPDIRHVRRHLSIDIFHPLRFPPDWIPAIERSRSPLFKNIQVCGLIPKQSIRKLCSKLKWSLSAGGVPPSAASVWPSELSL